MSGLFDIGWTENTIYPGTHWMYHDERYEYRARVDLNTWTNGLYQWRVMEWSMFGKDIMGEAPTLQEAMNKAEEAMKQKKEKAAANRPVVQLRLFQ